MHKSIVIIIIVVLILVIIAIWLNRDSVKKDKIKVESNANIPSNIQIKVEDNQVLASWDKINDAVFYTAYYSTEPFEGKETYKVLGPLNEPKFEMGCIPKGTYYFKLTASMKVGDNIVESRPTTLSKIQIDKCMPAKPVQSLTAKREDEYIVLNWKPSVDADLYYIVIDVALNDGEKEEYKEFKITDPMQTQFRFKLEMERTWFIRVDSENNNCPGRTSSQVINLVWNGEYEELLLGG